MTDEEANEVLKELDKVRPEMLNDKAKRLFNAIMTIADERDKYKAEIEKKDKIIDEMATECSIQTGRWENLSNEDIIEYFTNKVEEENK